MHHLCPDFPHSTPHLHIFCKFLNNATYFRIFLWITKCPFWMLHSWYDFSDLAKNTSSTNKKNPWVLLIVTFILLQKKWIYLDLMRSKVRHHHDFFVQCQVIFLRFLKISTDQLTDNCVKKKTLLRGRNIRYKSNWYHFTNK